MLLVQESERVTILIAKHLAYSVREILLRNALRFRPLLGILQGLDRPLPIRDVGSTHRPCGLRIFLNAILVSKCP